MNKIEFIRHLLKDYEVNYNINFIKSEASVNFALIKYWGKANEEMMIPTMESLSFKSKEFLGTKVEIEKNDENILMINDINIEKKSIEYINLFEFINLFNLPFNFFIKTYSNIPIASGVASSSAIFAALTKGMLKFYHNKYDKKIASIIARFGSISASRSILDSNFQKLILEENYTHSIEFDSKINFYFKLLQISSVKKGISSREGMKISKNSSQYKKWLYENKNDLIELEKSMMFGDYKNFFKIVINNSEKLQKLMQDSGINYNLEKTILIKKKIIEMNKDGLEIAFTQDAGANLKIIAKDSNLLNFLSIDN